jgi:nucleoside 2-deoxyribosyltransferase
MSDEVRYPQIEVDLGDLDGPDGNAFAVLGKTVRALEAADVSLANVNLFREEATSDDYEHLLATVHAWVCVR